MLTFHRPQGMAWKRWAKSHLVKAEPIVFFPMCKGDQHQCYKDSCPNGGACDHVESMYPPPEFSLRGFFLSRSRPFRPYGMGDLLYISSSLRYRGFISFCYMSRARFRLYIYIFFWGGEEEEEVSFLLLPGCCVCVCVADRYFGLTRPDCRSSLLHFSFSPPSLRAFPPPSLLPRVRALSRLARLYRPSRPTSPPALRLSLSPFCAEGTESTPTTALMT